MHESIVFCIVRVSLRYRRNESYVRYLISWWVSCCRLLRVAINSEQLELGTVPLTQYGFFLQVAQLSQRDRAAGWVSFGHWDWETIFCGHYRFIFHCNVIGLQIYRIRWKNSKWRLLRRWRSFKVTDVDINRKPVCDFLLVLNTNWHFIPYRFPRVGPEHPISPLSIYFLIFPPFTFLFLSLALLIFFFCPSLLFINGRRWPGGRGGQVPSQNLE